MLKKVLLFCLVLLLPSVAWAQSFNQVYASNLYPSTASGNFIPPNSSYAILVYKSVPSLSTPSSSRSIVEADIIPSYTSPGGVQVSTHGWYRNFDDGAYSLSYLIIDASSVYTRNSSPLSSTVLNTIQNLLVQKNLGTVQQRAALIRGFHSGPVQILDIDNFKKSILNALSPFLNIYLGIFLTLFVVDLMSKKSQDVIAESAKIQRRAERAQQRREIRADPTAQIFEFRLANFSSIASGSVSDPSISRRKARRLFEDTAMEYAEYKKSRGWKY